MGLFQSVEGEFIGRRSDRRSRHYGRIGCARDAALRHRLLRGRQTHAGSGQQQRQHGIAAIRDRRTSVSHGGDDARKGCRAGIPLVSGSDRRSGRAAGVDGCRRRISQSAERAVCRQPSGAAYHTARIRDKAQACAAGGIFR